MVPLVSILIPAYNAARWIGDTLKSAIGQTWPRKEIIVVDDGSTDDTLAFARQFSSKEVCIVNQQNQGGAAARNAAFKLCQGDYIQWLDADDLLTPHKIESQMKLLAEVHSDRLLASAPWARFIRRVSKAEFRPSVLWCNLDPLECVLRKHEKGAFLQTGCWLVSRALTEAAGPWDTRLMGDDDGEYFTRVVLASEGMLFDPCGAVLWRIPGYNRLSYVGRNRAKQDAHWLSTELTVGHILKYADSPRVRAACLNCVQSAINTLHPWRPDLVRQAVEFAVRLGGEAKVARLNGKYEWIRGTVGESAAYQAKYWLPRAKRHAAIAWDTACYHAKCPSLDEALEIAESALATSRNQWASASLPADGAINLCDPDSHGSSAAV